MSQEDKVPRNGWGRRQGEVDPITQEPITPLDLKKRVITLEHKVDRDRTENRVLYVIVVLLLVCGAYLYDNVNDTAAANEQETLERRDQSCSIFERKQREDVNQLRQTYQYILSLSPSQLKEPLNTAILTFLPETEKAAKIDDAPAFCDEVTEDGKDIGEPEPDPLVPERPDGIPKPQPQP